MTPQPPHANNEVLYVEPDELSAMLIAVDIYIRVLQGAGLPAVSRDIVLPPLQSLKQHCQALISQIAQGKEHRRLLPVLCSAQELIVFGNSVEMYMHLEKAGMIAYLSVDGSMNIKEEIDIIGRLLAVQQRYLLSTSLTLLSSEE
ncbi:MAG TPA: hypothetical protein VFB12_07170 [Ktedonobacteraceae bacterium]|nr:hypothetical protein [Ktedonobacteraceae bacterium]